MFPENRKPIFDGWGDVENYLEWERDMDRIFRYHSLTPQERVNKAIKHLKGRALTWWENNVITKIRHSETPTSSWTCMKHELRRRFVPYSHFTELRRRFRKLFQGSNSVEEYYREHRQLQSLLGIDYPEWELMEHFMEGLNDEAYQMAKKCPHHSPRELVWCLTETSLRGRRKDEPKVSQPIPTPRYDSGLSSNSKPVPGSQEAPQHEDGREFPHEDHVHVLVEHPKVVEEQELVSPEPLLEEQDVALSVEPFPVVEAIVMATPQVHEDLGRAWGARLIHGPSGQRWDSPCYHVSRVHPTWVAVGKLPRPEFIPIEGSGWLQVPFDPGKSPFPSSI